MPWYKNTQARVIGLSYKADGAPRLVQPGEVFEASETDIPAPWLEQKWFEQTQAPATTTTVTVTTTTGAGALDQPHSVPDANSATAITGSGQFTGPEPVQGSGTSVLESATDKEAAESGAYDRDAHIAKRRK